MDTDEKLKWLESRISTSLRPRADELRGIFVRDETRATFIEFFSNDEAHRLFVFFASEDKGGGLKVSLNAPKKVIEKCICFVKTGTASQLHSGNFDDGLTCLDWSHALPHGDMFVREVLLPLLCTDTDLISADAGLAITSDKLMDILHRLLGNIEVSMGVAEGNVTLALPCIEVLAEAAAFDQRQPAVVHVLESAVVGWIRQIKNVLHHDALAATLQISKERGEPVRPHHEIEMWNKYIEHTTSILQQLEAPVASDILMNLTHANSVYAQSFGEVRGEIERALAEARARLRCFETVSPWIHDMYRTSSVDSMLKVFPALLHTVLLIWKHSEYYHEPKPFAQMLKMLSNEVVARARSLVGENPFDDTQRSYKALKDALRLCAAFRGTYLDFKETANAYNQEKVQATVLTMARLRPKDKNVLFRTRMYGAAGYQDWVSRAGQREESDDDAEQWADSPWPARNTRCFAGLSRFVERCNDLLDLVETTRHFLTLEEAARIGGAGSRALDALIADIHQVFVRTIKDFTSHNRDVLTIDERQHFENSFFRYRSVIKTLEHRLAGVLRSAIRLCPNAMSHLRVLEVFEGISARELLQKELQSENQSLIVSLTNEFRRVKEMFSAGLHDVPHHVNMPPTVSKLVWVRGMKERVGHPMAKVRQVCPHALESDIGWQLRDAFMEAMNDLEKYETRLLLSWAKSVDSDLREKLKQPVLATESLEAVRGRSESRLWNPHNSARDTTSNGGTEYSSEKGEKASAVSGLKINLDPRLLEMLRDVHYLQRSPHDVPVPASVRALLRSVDSSILQKRATRLATVVSKYNHVKQRMEEYEELLFDGRMEKVEKIIQDGKEKVTWGSADLDDFLEQSSSVVCDDVHAVLTRVHNNWDRAKDMSMSWSQGALDIFTSHIQEKATKGLKQLLDEQNLLDEEYRRKILPSGQEIHQILYDSFKAVEMSEASPAWQMYTVQMDALVLMALKSSILTSLDAMYRTVAGLDAEGRDDPTSTCILEIRLELVEQTVAFSPPLDRSASVDNVEDAVSSWLSSFLKRSTLVKRLTDASETYKDFLTTDQDVYEIVEEIRNVVQENTSLCKKLLSKFDDYKFLWVQDVQQSFRDFLSGRPSPNPLRVSKQSHRKRSDMSRATTGQRSRFLVHSPDAINEAERVFLTPHADRGDFGSGGGSDPDLEPRAPGGEFVVVPGLADFDDEIAIYRTARDNIAGLPDRQSVGWLVFDFQPIKQVLTTYASKWMWTFVRFLCDQVTDSLDTLADFLARTEPEIESITGEERDTASFMKMMRLFNEVSAQQQDMDSRFAVMQRTVNLLEKYEMKLPAETQQMFRSAPDRWNHLKTKVSLAKQRLGPRIQEESDRITRDLLRFSDRVEALASELRSSEVFSRECPFHAAIEIIDGFSRRLRALQAEAQDLIELQELLETAVVNFSVLPQYQRDLRNLKLVWDHVQMLEEEQRDWKRKHWQKIDTKHLHQAIQKQKDLIQSLPPETTEWDVYMGMIGSIVVIEQCLPLVEDLNHPAMRTRHWKQLVRITGGLLQTDTDSLRKMILGDLLELGLQKHGDEVKAIVQRAVKDLTIESSLKTCEEVWLSKVFELRNHTRSQSKNAGPVLEGSEATGSEMMPHALMQTHEAGGSKTGGTRTKSMKSGPHSRSSDKTGAGSISRGRGGGRTSVLSLPISLLNLVDDPSPICLLKNVEKILSDLEHHQMELTRMQSNSAIGSFLDEVTKWQKKLHLIEAVLESWVNVQRKWVQLDEIYSGADVRTALAHEANMFAVMSKDFRLLMRATEKNTNVLQGCSRKGLLPMLEKMDVKMEQCRHALLGNLERRRQKFPRFYFLSPEDVMNIVCYGYDLNAVNKYLCKVLPHLGRLIFTEQPPANKLAPGRMTAGGRKRYKVTGVSSTAGEVMTFHRPLMYEGPMSLWLPQLLMAIQATLQEHLHVALGNEPRPAQIEQTLRSVGASKVRISRPSSAVSQRSGGSDQGPKVVMTPPGPPPASDSESGRDEQPLGAPQRTDISAQLNATLGGSIEKDEVSWTLDNTTQVVLLATAVKLTDRMRDALSSVQSGDPQALVKVADDVSDSLHAAVIMLKGIEDERMVHTKGTRKTVGSRGRDKDHPDGKNNEDNESDSIGAPSTRSSLDDDMDMDVDDAYNEDAMGPSGDSGQGGPINTMQSLLFTEQVRSGSRATKGDLIEMELREAKDQDTRNASSARNDGKLLLFPCQIRKISGLIGLLTQQRDLCHRLRDAIVAEGSQDAAEKLFEWEAHLKHSYSPDDMGVKVQAMTWSFDYGYEYQGSCQRYVVSPSCDRVLLSICQALQSHSGVAITSGGVSSAPETLSELSYQLGRGLYAVLCTQSMDHYMLGDLFKGTAETGCWICLHRFNSLRTSLLSVAGQLAAEVQRALKAGKSSITLMSEDISLSPSAACFVTLDPESRVTLDPGSLNRAVPTVAVGMPIECTSYFRVVHAVSPDRRTVLEIQLLSQGFTQAHELSRKLCHLLDLCGSLLSTIPANRLQTAHCQDSSAGGARTHIVFGDNAITSLPLFEHVIAGAGSSLDVLLREQLEMKQEYRDQIVQKTRKFASIWKHRSSLMSSSGGLAASSTAGGDSGTEGGQGLVLPGVGGTSSSSMEQSLDLTTQEAMQISKDREIIESNAESMKKMEEVALVTSLRNLLLPRLAGKEERNLLCLFVSDLFPSAEEEVDFMLDDEDRARTQEQHHQEDHFPSVEGGMNLEVSIPDHRLESDSRPFEAKQSEHEPISDVEAAVAVATAECGLSPAAAFQSKAAQLTELAESMRSVVVCGEAGCGKSRCIDVYAETQKQLGFRVTTKKVFVNAVDSRRKLFGYFEGEHREWRDGLIQQMIRPHCLKQDNIDQPELLVKPNVLLLHVDGWMQAEDADIFLQLLRSEPGATASAGPTSGNVGSSSWLSLPNNERVNLPLDLRVIWEVEDLSCLAPNILSQLGVLGFSGNEISPQLHINHWLRSFPDAHRLVTRDIVMRYVTRLLGHFAASTTPSHLIADDVNGPRLRQTVRVTPLAMTGTFCKLVDCLLHSDCTAVERERYVAYAAFWAFGGTLDADSREAFAAWWSKTWPGSFPSGLGDPWRQFVDSESRNFARWDDHLPQFSGADGSSSAFVHTPDASQLAHLVGALMDAGHAAMLAGPLGCGKSAIMRERVNNVSSGEVAEVLSLFVHCNRLTEAGNLWARVSEHLEWKHGSTFTPRGNKKLLCMVDDLNLARPIGGDISSLQSACELIRQHLDIGGVVNPNTYKWQQVTNTAYVTTINPRPSACSNPVSQRMSRHFSVFSCPYPSVETQHSIFSTLIQSRILTYHGGSPSLAELQNEKPMEVLLSKITMVTVELQDRLRGMYLTTPERAHYNLALGDLEKIFRNLMTSLAPGCHQRDLLLLWRHECDWMYRKRMISTVDCERYQQALDTSMRKHLTDNKYLRLLLAPKQPLFSSVRELESGMITAGRHFGRNSSSKHAASGGGHVTDYYKMVTNQREVHDLLGEALKEYNKVNVRMRLNFYDDTITLICRIARILQSSHSQSHSVLFGEGCPAMAALIVNISAHLGGFRVVTLPPHIAISSGDSPSHGPSHPKPAPSSLPELEQRRLQHFKHFLVQLYNNSGVKGEKIVFLLHDDKELNHECLAVVEEFVCYGAISHLFTPEEQTTIANSVRSEVTAAGLTYSKEIAWHFFISTVRKNLRVVLICSKTGDSFMEKSLQFPSLFSRMNMIALHHWSREQLVANATYHFNKPNSDVASRQDDDDDDVIRGGDVTLGRRARRHVMDARGQENVAHLLASMHTVVRIRDDDKFYRVPGHVSNYAYEKLVERFVQLYRERRQAVKKSHMSTKGALENIDRENRIAEALQKDLDREKKVLEEHRAGTLQLLAQIGQDMVITEQQVSAVRRQIKKIRHLKKTLPEYQLAHEKAVFKTAAIVADTKKVVSEIDVQALQELRSQQKPDSEVEDLMAAIIMILKSPNSDVSWSKGAKRQMANLDRFIDELMTFDEMTLPLPTLENLESFLEKESFTPDILMQKAAGNTAVGSLVKWVQGVFRYHTTLISKVKPLHEKVEETSVSIGDAQHKLRQLEAKKEALEARLRDLAEGFEQATADKNTQEEKRSEMEEHLRVAGKFRRILAGEHRRCGGVLDTYQGRLDWVTGAAAVSAGFATYLSAYPYMLRRFILTIDWPQCLAERGIPLVFDSTDPVTGHVIEFMLDVNESISDMSPRRLTEGDTMLDAVIAAGNMASQQEEGEQEKEAPSMQPSSSEEAFDPVQGSNAAINMLPPVAEETDADDEADPGADADRDVTNDGGSGGDDVEGDAEAPSGSERSRSAGGRKSSQPEVETTASRLSQGALVQPYSLDTLRFITAEEYQNFLSSVMKVLVGEDVLQEWKTKDFAHHQLQNAAVMLSSWQRPPLLLDPYLNGVDWCAVHLRQNRDVTPVNLTHKINSGHVTAIEKAVLAGNTLILMDCEHHAGALARPLIHYANTAGGRDERSDESQTVRFLGRRLLCPESFKLYLTTTQMTSSRIHPDVMAASQLISYVSNGETLQEDLLLRALMRVRPDIYRERRRVARCVRQHRHTLAQLDAILCERLVTGDDPKTMENSTKFLSNVVELKAVVAQKLTESERLLSTLNSFTDELFPIAQRAALLYSICRAIPALNIHYQIPLPFFLHLFDSSVGSEFEDEEDGSSSFALQDVEIVHAREDADMEEEEERKMRKEALARRKASLRLGSAKNSMKKRKGRRVAAIAESSEDENEEHQVNSDEKPKQDEEEGQDEGITDDDDAASKASTGSYVVIPDVTSPRGEQVEYESYPGNDIKETVDRLTRRVFANIYVSVFPEHRILITTLALLNIQQDSAEPPFAEEDLGILIFGNPGFGKEIKVSLSDFGCESSPPDWLPADRWDDLLAFGVYHESLMGICVQVAEDPGSWKEWYEIKNPETAKFPIRTEEGEGEETGGDNLSELHRLLLIKTLRPDRYEPALSSYVQQHLDGTPLKEVVESTSPPIDTDTLFRDVSNTLGILVLLPEDDEPEVMSRVSAQPADVIRRLAEKLKVTMESVVLGDGYLQEATRCIDSALSQDSWALIHGLHLAPDRFFEDLQIQLARVGNVSRRSEHSGENPQGASSQAAHFQVWLTSTSHASLPSLLTQYLYKLSWDSLLQMVTEIPSITSMAAANCSILKSCIVSSFSMVSPDLHAPWAEAAEPIRPLLFATPLCHALLLARQSVGWHGNHRRYLVQQTILNQALTSILQEAANASTVKQIYADIISTENDQMFMTQLFDDVINQVTSSSGSITLNDVSVAIPPSRTPSNEMSAWFRQNLPDELDVTAVLSLPDTATLWRTAQHAETINMQLQHLFNAMQQPGYETNLLSPGSTRDVNEPTLTLARLQNVIDLCWEKLPPLLELGQANQGRLKDYDFPYHRPSVLSAEETGLPHMPESIGFVLLQECIWFNRCVCVARQQLHELRWHLFATGDYKLSKDLRETAEALYEEEVPRSWQHPNELPNTHVLLTWIDDVIKRYAQMRSWVKTGMVPLDGKTPLGPVTSIWLGGLVNPGALLMALCTEAVAAYETTHDQIRIRCLPVSEHEEVAEQTAGMFLENVLALNCTWDEEKGRFRRVGSTDDGLCVRPCPLLYFYPIVIGKEEEEQEQSGKRGAQQNVDENLVEFPVYMNVSRQSLVAYFPLSCDDAARYKGRPGRQGPARAHDCGVLLQDGPDLARRDTRKSRAYLAQKRREQWSRVSPAVSELMSRSGTRMSSARQSYSGPRMSVTSLPPSIAGATKAPLGEEQPGKHQLYPEDTFVVSQKSSSSRSSSIADARQRDQLPGASTPPKERRPLPNGHVTHLKGDHSSEEGAAPPSGENTDREPSPNENGPNQDSQRTGDGDKPEEATNDGEFVDDPHLEREGSLLQAILDDEQTTEDEV